MFLLKFAVSPCYWCVASFVLTAKKILDCCPVCLQRLMQSLQSKVSDFFFFSKIEFTRNKTSSCIWGPCRLQNLQRLPAWTRPLWGLQMYLKLLEKKMVSARATMKLILSFILFYFIFSSDTDSKHLKIFSVGFSSGRSWRGRSVNSQ